MWVYVLVGVWSQCVCIYHITWVSSSCSHLPDERLWASFLLKRQNISYLSRLCKDWQLKYDNACENVKHSDKLTEHLLKWLYGLLQDILILSFRVTSQNLHSSALQWTSVLFIFFLEYQYICEFEHKNWKARKLVGTVC